MEGSLNTSYDLLVITGPTASGKTALASHLAYRLGGEVISADSRQIYRGMNLGTGKDYDDYIVNGIRVPCHLLDIVDPGYKYNVFEYQRDFNKVYSDLKRRNVFPVVCGGSGMYADSIIKGYRMQEVPADNDLRARLESKSMEELIEILSSFKNLHNITDIDTKKRVIRAIEIEFHSKNKSIPSSGSPKINTLVVGVLYDRDKRRNRISQRLKQRLDDGMIDEVKNLIDKGVTPEVLIYYGLEYKFITFYLTGKLSYDEMFRELEIAIHQFAKRQMTWFRGMERKGTVIHWINGEIPLEEKVNIVINKLGENNK